LTLALVGRAFHERPSRLLNVDNEAAALDFDVAAATRLLYYDMMGEDRMARRIAYHVWIGFTGERETKTVAQPGAASDETEDLEW
jgi:hypothetical protein